jgi:HlyD family secretion protein
LASAQASYRQLSAGNTDTQQTVNEAQLRQAEIALNQAQQAYNKIKDQPDSGLMPQSQQLQQATSNYEVALAQVGLTEEGPNQAQFSQGLNQIAQAQSALRQAQAQVVNAQNNLETLLEGPSAEDLTIARAQVKQAQLSQLQAENSLNNARLTAPFDGVISHMKVLVDEIDVRQVAVGQPVRLTVDALPDSEISGVVTKISPTAANVNGVIAYEVTIAPDMTDAPLRAGMSATASITTADVDDALLLSNRFIQLDRDTGKAYVYKMVDGEPVLQEVELGLRNDRQSQILAGLQPGDVVALVSLTGEQRLRGALFGGG